MRKIIIHVNTEDYMLGKMFQEDLSIIRDFSEKNEIHNMFFYPSEKEPPILLNSKNVEVRNFVSEEDLVKSVKVLGERDEVVLITTGYDIFVGLINRLRQGIGQKISEYPEMYNDKSIQRELLYKNDLYVSVNYLKLKLEELNFDYISEKIGVPFVLKPTGGKLSMGVVKIKTEKNLERYLKNYKELHEKIVKTGLSGNNEFVAEEYINGELYSVDYFIDQEGNPIIARPVRVTLGTDLDINDFCNITRIVSKEVEKEYDMAMVEDFVKKNIKATGMKNTFVHHEFKINKKGIYKTIELNGRVGGKRLIIYDGAYGVNLYCFVLGKEPEFNLINNIAYFRVFACKKGILKEINNKILEKIEKLESFNRINIHENMIGAEVGLTKDGFEYVISIELKNEDNKQLDKDIKFIENNYCDILEIE